MSEQTEEDHIVFPSPLFVSSSGDSLLLSNRGGSVSGSSITSLNTTATDDFMSTVENVEDLAMLDEDTVSARAKKLSIPETEEEEPDNTEPPTSIEATKEEVKAPQSNRIASPNTPAIPPMEPKDDETPELTIETPTNIGTKVEETEAPPSKIQVASTPVMSTEESEDESVPELDRESNSRSMPIVDDGAAQLEQLNIPTFEEEAEATPTSSANTEESNPDAAANVYKGAKGVWAWGKSIPVFSPFMGIAEAVAGTALAVAGTNLQDLDSNLVEPQLQNLDSAILNPAIKTVAGIMLGAVGKAEGIVKPIVVIVLSPFKMLQQQPSNEEQEGRNLQMG